MSRFRILRRLARYSLVAFLGFLLLLSASLWYVTTDSFQQMVRRRLTAAIEHASGGRVELGSFHVVPFHFQVEVRNLTIHGREAPSERPLLQVDSMSAVVDLSSILGLRMAFSSLVLVHPVVHILYYPDGSTNAPLPQQKPGATFDELLAISVHRLEVRRGEVFLQQQRVPFDFVSNDVEARVDYSFLHRRYSGNISVGKAEAKFAGYRPVAWAAKTDFSIGRDEIQLPSFSVTAEGSHLQGGGTVSDFRQPTFRGKYDLLLDLRQTAAVLRLQQTSSGNLRLRGTASWSTETYSTAGDFDLKDALWSDPAFTAKELSALGKFSVDPQKFALTQVQGKFLRGTFTSELEVVNWNAPSKPAARTTRQATQQPAQRGIAAIKAKDMAVSDLLASLGPRFREIQGQRFSGSLSGTSEVQWKGSPENAQLSSAISIRPTARVSRGELPLTASTHFTYRLRPSALDISDLTASTPATQIRAAGVLSSSNSLRVSVASDNIGEWKPLMTSLFPAGLPLAVAGRAAFSGTVTGSVTTPVFNGNLQLNDFDTPGQTLVHWDSLKTDLQLSSASLVLHNALFRRADASLSLDGSVGLYDWKSQPASAIHLRADAENVSAADLVTLSRQNVAATGTVNVRLEISGTLSKPQGQGTAKWTNGSVNGYAFDVLTASANLENRRLTFGSLEVARAQSHFSGKGWYDLSTRAFAGNLSGNNFNLADIAPLQRSRVKVAGTIDFSAQASGTIDKPDITARLHIRNVAFNEEAAGDYVIDAVTHGPDLHLSGHSEFDKAELLIDGDVQLRELWPARIDFHFNRLDVDSFLESYLHGHITGHSAVAGDLVLQGPLRDPRRVTLVGNLTDLYADVEKVKLRNDGPIRFTLNEQTLTINSLHLIGENTDFSAAGSMQLREGQLNLHGSGKVGLQLVHGYDPDLSGSGTIAGQVNVTGTISAPIVRGVLQVENAAISDINLPSALSDLNGTLQFSQNRVTIEKLTGRTGGGTVSFTGNAQLNGRQVNFDLAATADSVRLRYPPGVSSTATATLRWNGSSSGSLLSGDITVTKLGVTPGFDFGAYLERSIQTSSLPQTDPVLNNIRLDLHVVTAPDLQMQTSVLRLRGDADLRVRGNAAKPVLLGRADVFEGEAYFSGTKYRLERGGITFGTPAANNSAASVPFVDLEATTHVRDYDITLSITGPADHPTLNYRSEPPLPTNDIIGLLAFGQTSEDSALQQSSQSAFSQQASNALLAAALNATLNNRTQRLFGNSRIKIDPQGLETETSPTQSGPAVTIEEQVKDNLTLTYTTNVAQTSQQIIRAEYYLSRNISVVAIRDQNGVVSFDVKIRRRKR